MKFTYKQFAELPFILNIPEEVYTVQIDGENLSVRIHHNLYAGAPGPLEYPSPVSLGEKQTLIATLSQHSNYSLLQLRTVVSTINERIIQESDLCKPTPDDLVNEYAGKLIQERASNNSGEKLLAEARQQLEALTTAEANVFRKSTALRLTGKRLFPNTEGEVFLRTVNHLIRNYMASVQDFFVEEVTLYQVGGTTPRGVLQITECEDEIVDVVTLLGKIPPAMREPWFTHPEDKVAAMRTHLASGEEPDAVALLRARARGLLERGAYRSAIIESSAALETAVARRIVRGMVDSGSLEQDALDTLHQTQRFSDRCKKLMKNVTGKSLPELDNVLWARVVGHRDNYRHKIAHSDHEPSRPNAENVVQDFLKLASLVLTFTP